MALKQNENAPWYEKSGLIRVPTDKRFDYGIIGTSFIIPLRFSFPIGDNSVTSIFYSWGSIYMNPSQTRVKWGDGYIDKTYCLDLRSFASGLFSEHLFYESKSDYVRILSIAHVNSRYTQHEIIFFSNGNIQIKASGNSEGYISDSENPVYTSIYYEDKISSDTNASSEKRYLVRDNIRMNKNESVLIVRNSSSDYQIYHNAYWENDSRYTIPLRTRIISNIILYQKDEEGKYFHDSGFYEIPIYSTEAYNSRIKIKTDKGIGNIRLQSPQSQDLINPPLYLYDKGIKYQADCGYQSTKVDIFHMVSSSWGNLVNNKSPENTSDYYWINPAYRYFDEPVNNVSRLYIRCGVDQSKASRINNNLYIYYSAKSGDELRSSDFTYSSRIVTTGNSGEYNDVIVELPRRQTVGAILLLCGITGSNAQSAFEFSYDIGVEVQNGLQLI